MKNKVSLFDIGYCLYFLSLFLPDVNIAGSYITVIIQLIRYTSYLFFICHIFFKNHYSLHSFLGIIIFISFVGLIAFFTRDIYYLAICLIILASLYEDKYKIIKNSFIMLLTCSITVAFLTTIGVINNVINVHTSGTNRFGLGYYHSDVFPLIVFYLFSWRILIKKRLQSFELILFSIITLLTYKFCVSRNGLVTCCILILYALISNKHTEKEKELKDTSLLTRISCRYSILIMTVFSLLLTVLNGNYLISVYKINELFSGRFALAYHKMNDVGLHIINVVTGDVFAQSHYVLDNGYMYVILRYGLVFMLFYIYIQHLICKKYDSRICIIFMITTVSCMVDNDLFSYGFLPYILLAFNKRQDDQYTKMTS